MRPTWDVREIEWCVLCDKRERNADWYCAHCEAEIDEALRKFEEMMADG